MEKKSIIIDTNNFESLKDFVSFIDGFFDNLHINTVFGEERAYKTYEAIKESGIKNVFSGSEKALFSDEEIEIFTKENYIQKLEATMEKSNENFSMIAFGPLTNIAAFILSNPKLKKRIEVIHIIGGTLIEGIDSIVGEKNFLADPEAAKIVVDSGIPLKIYCKDKNIETKQNLDFLEKYFNREINDKNYLEALVAYSMCKGHKLIFSESFVDVDLCGEYTRGDLTVDFCNVLNKEYNAKLFLGIRSEQED